MKAKLLTSLCAFGMALTVKAQDIKKLQSPVLHQTSFEVTMGTQGVGGDFVYGFARKWAVRGGASFIPLTMNNAFPVSGISSDNKLTANFSNVHLLADFTPFKKASYFRLVGGGAYFIKASGNFRVNPNTNYNYGDITLTPSQTGNMNLNTDWSGFAPYFGFGFAHLFPHRFFNVNFDLGSYYLPSPQTSIEGTGLLSGNSSQNGQFHKNMSSYRFLPVAQLNFNFKL